MERFGNSCAIFKTGRDSQPFRTPTLKHVVNPLQPPWAGWIASCNFAAFGTCLVIAPHLAHATLPGNVRTVWVFRYN